MTRTSLLHDVLRNPKNHTPASSPRSTPTFRGRIGLIAAGLACAVSASLGFTVPAYADSGPVTITGSVECLNSVPSGAWIEAADSTSGFAQLSPIYALGKNTTLAYTFVLDHGGPFHINVGCGGTPQAWGMTAVTPDTDAIQADWVCNDISGWLAKLGNWALKREFGLRADLTQGVQYGTCVQQ